MINNQSQYAIEWEPYFEHGVAKLRPKQQLTKDSFSPAAQEMAAVIYGLNDTNTPESKARGTKNSQKNWIIIVRAVYVQADLLIHPEPGSWDVIASHTTVKWSAPNSGAPWSLAVSTINSCINQ